VPPDVNPSNPTLFHPPTCSEPPSTSGPLFLVPPPQPPPVYSAAAFFSFTQIIDGSSTSDFPPPTFRFFESSPIKETVILSPISNPPFRCLPPFFLFLGNYVHKVGDLLKFFFLLLDNYFLRPESYGRIIHFFFLLYELPKGFSSDLLNRFPPGFFFIISVALRESLSFMETLTVRFFFLQPFFLSLFSLFCKCLCLGLLALGRSLLS